MPQLTGTVRFGDFVLKPDEGVLKKDGHRIRIPPKALKLLNILVENRGRTVSKQELMEVLWPDTFVEEGNLAYTVRVLRSVLDDSSESPKFLETIPKYGYRFLFEAVETGETHSPLRSCRSRAAVSEANWTTGRLIG